MNYSWNNLISNYYFTESMRDLIPEPDVTVRGKYRTYDAWSEALLEEILRDPDIKEKLAKNEARRRKLAPSYNKAVKTKAQKTMDLVENAVINVARQPLPQIYQAAEDRYLARSLEHYNFVYDYPEERLHWDAINYIRHELTSYDHSLSEIKAKTGTNKAYRRLTERIYDEIAKVYPDNELQFAIAEQRKEHLNRH